MKQGLFMIAIVLAGVFQFAAIAPDEGMFPLSEIRNVDLQKAGLKIPQSEVYNPNGLSLIDALVNVGGCTGSFVSAEGLIITNHHCAFEAVQLASTPEKDYLQNGFVARAKNQEIEAKNLSCKITDSYEDVSERVLAAAKEVTDPAARINAINAKIASIIKEEEQKDKTIKAEVSEMFIGRTYVLFRYKTIKDVRLVYVPHRAIGEFGGESDNWVWPRHTGDFSFLRAYVAPDGSAAPYSKNNVPYKPKKFLKVNPNGVKENDFVFILGYPGRTFRNYPAKYIEYQEKYQLPYISNLFKWQNDQMLNTSTNKELELKQASRIKRKANVLKNYQGKLKGLKGIDLVKQKYEQEKELQAFVNGDEELKKKYGNLMNDIGMVYDEIFADAQKHLVLEQFIPSSNALSAANIMLNLQKKIAEAKVEDQDRIYNESKTATLKQLQVQYESFVLATDRLLLKRALEDVLALPNSQQIKMNASIKNSLTAEKFIEKLFTKSKFSEPNQVDGLLSMSVKDFMKFEDPMLTFVKEIRIEVDKMNADKKTRSGKLNPLLAAYVDLSILYKKKSFIPDANSTLRLTYGYVRGYSPVDATYMRPFTSLSGIIEKGSSSGDYYLPDFMRELYKQKAFGKFTFPDRNDVPVAFLYNMDTTGGNSGSPIMDENGNLIGVNFDRAYEATINDFAWNEAYSRSIGCDIRYILWVAQQVDKADNIVKELGVE